jgi:predicted dehydrogenase
MKKLGIGMIGYGGIARVHAMAYRTIPFHYGLPDDMITIVGVAGRSQESAQKSAQELGCQFWTADYHNLLARSDIDVIDCSVPNDQHEQIIIAAANAGKHIYCEKPLAMDG